MIYCVFTSLLSCRHCLLSYDGRSMKLVHPFCLVRKGRVEGKTFLFAQVQENDDECDAGDDCCRRGASGLPSAVFCVLH
jgi:hypothetical protein